MSLNQDNGNSSWSAAGQQNNDQQQNTVNSKGTLSSGLAGLFGLNSMTSDSRNLKEVGETSKLLTEIYERINNSTTNEIQRKIIPTIESLTSSISPLLPGLGMHRQIGDVLYIMAALFSCRANNIGSERITINQPNQISQQVSIPLSPAQYHNTQLVEKLKEHYSRYAETKNVKNISIINIVVVDLEMLNHPEAGEAKDHPHHIANFLASEWEEAILVKTASEIVASNQDLPSPFIHKQAPYGKDNCAEARVTAVSGRVTKARTLSASNMEVVASTINNPNSSNNNYHGNSREIARVLGTVHLAGVSWEEHTRQMMARQQQQQMDINAFMGAFAGMSPYPNNYRPLRPVITIDSVTAGEMMGYNGGLAPFFFGLYLLMTTNNQYVWAEALRKQSVGARGSLADLEIRIEQLLKGTPAIGMAAQRTQLTEKLLADTDLVNTWIRQNVSPHATFQINLIPAGPGASIHNFLGKLGDTKINAQEVKTTVALLDAMSQKKFSAIVARNIDAKTGWNPSKPILIPTGMIAVNGLAEYGGRKLNTEEMDEMMICHVKGKQNSAGIEALLATQYGSTNEDPKQRSQKLRMEYSQSVFDGAVHINGFAHQFIWAPDFMAAMGEALDSIGQLTVANNLGSWRSNSLVYAPGVGLATNVGAGTNNNQYGAFNLTGYNMSTPYI